MQIASVMQSPSSGILARLIGAQQTLTRFDVTTANGSGASR